MTAFHILLRLKNSCWEIQNTATNQFLWEILS